MFAKMNDKVVKYDISSNEELPAEIQIEELKQKLSETDYAIIKIAEGSATAEEYADVIELRKSWREEINRLEDELNADT